MSTRETSAESERAEGLGEFDVYVNSRSMATLPVQVARAIMMEAPNHYGVQIRNLGPTKGKGLFASKTFEKGDIILEEEPLVSCQFAWNKAYKYLACDYCMCPLETVEENVRRLTAGEKVTIPYKEFSPTIINIQQCFECNTKYCSDTCRDKAYHQYHRTLCYPSNNTDHPIQRLIEAWKVMHYPPETTNIMLLVRILAMINQAPNPEMMCNKIKQFCHRTVNDDAHLVHKLLGDKFVEQLEVLRVMTAEAISGPYINEFLTHEGFRALIALIGTNGQGIGSSPVAQWANAVLALDLPEPDNNAFDKFLNKLYDSMEKESGPFINSEGSGLYQLQSSCNHSCVPNAEIAFPFNTHRLQMKALQPISVDTEITISYLDECKLSRSRYTRQKELATNYLFTCSCDRCLRESGDPNMTSPETSEGEEDEEMSD